MHQNFSVAENTTISEGINKLTKLVPKYRQRLQKCHRWYNLNEQIEDVMSGKSSASHLAHNRSFGRRVIPWNRLHQYSQQAM